MENNDKKKRIRSQNFSVDQVRTLVNLIVTYANIIENKQSDELTWKEKEKAWEKVTELYNSQNTLSRSTKTLKIKYETLKKNIKKKKAHNRCEQYKTGGGVSDIIPFTDFEDKIIQIVSNIDGLPPANDDFVIIDERNELSDQAEDEERFIFERSDRQPSTSFLKVTENFVSEVKTPKKILENTQDEKENLFDGWTPTLLKKPLSQCLQKKKRKVNSGEDLKKRYSMVADSRSELIEIQIETARLDRLVKKKELEYIELKIQNEKDEHAKKMKSFDQL